LEGEGFCEEDLDLGGVEGPRPYIGMMDATSQPDLHMGHVGSGAIDGEDSHYTRQ